MQNKFFLSERAQTKASTNQSPPQYHPHTHTHPYKIIIICEIESNNKRGLLPCRYVSIGVSSMAIKILWSSSRHNVPFKTFEYMVIEY